MLSVRTRVIELLARIGDVVALPDGVRCRVNAYGHEGIFFARQAENIARRMGLTAWTQWFGNSFEVHWHDHGSTGISE